MAHITVEGLSLLSRSASGEIGNLGAYNPSFSPDGAKIVFGSDSSNLISSDANPFDDVFIKEIGTGEVTLAHASAAGVQGNGTAYQAVFSPDGTKVAFASGSTNLVPGYTSAVGSIFIKDLASGAVTLVSTSQNGIPANAASFSPLFSPDGTTLAFVSRATNLLPSESEPPPPERFDATNAIYIKNLVTGVVSAVGAPADGAPAAWQSNSPAFSPDGTKVAFVSADPTLLPGGYSGYDDVFVRDLVTGAVTRISQAANGSPANNPSEMPVFSPDGTKVAFTSHATNLGPSDSNAFLADVFIKDLATGAVTLVSGAADGSQQTLWSYRPSFSPDGTKIAFFSVPTNEGSGTLPGVYVKDLVTGELTRVAGSSDVNARFDWTGFSPDGKAVVFTSDASDLVAGDTNGRNDVFVVRLAFAAAPPPNGAPIATPDQAHVQEDGSVLVDVLANDADPDVGDALTLVSASVSAQGATVAVVDGRVRYTAIGPVVDALGEGQTLEDTFTYLVRDEAGAEGAGTVTVTVHGVDDAAEPGVATTGTHKADRLAGASGEDTLSGEQGDDRLRGLGGRDHLYGNQGRDTLEGGAGRDALYGGKGDDSLLGGGGADTLWGDHGDDALEGGAGADLFCVGKHGGRDIVIDFDHDGGDHIAVTAGLSWKVRSDGAGNAVIAFSSGGGELVLAAVAASSVDDGWFVAQ